MGSNLSRFLYPEESLKDQDVMDGGVPWTPDPVEEAMDSVPRVRAIGDVHHPKTTEKTVSPPMKRFDTESMEINSQLGGVISATDIVSQQRVVGSTNHLSKDVFDVHQVSRNHMIETPVHVVEEFSSFIDFKNTSLNVDVNQYYAPCDEAFDINFYTHTSQKEDVENILGNETPPPVNKELSYSVGNDEAPAFESVPGSEEIDHSPHLKNSEFLQGPQVDALIQENSEMGKSIQFDLEGGHTSQVSVLKDNNVTSDVIFNETSSNFGREMPEIHKQTASAGLEEGSNLDAVSVIPHHPSLPLELVQTNLDSPEETANVIMDEMLKSIFNNEDEEEAQRTLTEDEVNTIENPENNFVNVSQFVVTESIPLKFNPVTGEMVPDIETESDKFVVEQMSTSKKNVAINAPFQKAKEFLNKEKAMCSKNVAKVKPNSTSASRNIAKVKPLPQGTPLELMTILSASATPSSVPRQCSSRKCSCLKHSVLGYPPSSVLYWKVRTTPGIRKTIMDFDNEGVKFLYDDGCLRAFETVLKSFKPEFLAAEKSLEVSLCLSCVRWAEGEVNEGKKSSDSKVDNKSHKSTETLKTTEDDIKSRKRGGSKKAKKESSDGENVYKKKYTSRSRQTDFARDQHINEENNQHIKEESKSPKMLMYDLYCDMPGCNARLRGYPSLIKHFKAKHPDEAVTPEETGNLDKECSKAGANGLCTEVDSKYLTSINDPLLKLKAEEDMKLLYVKVENLQYLTLPSDICLIDKITDKNHLGKIKERKKSVGFKEGEGLVTIREISPRRPYETRNRGNDKNEMVATVNNEDQRVDKNQNQINKIEMFPETISPNKTSKSELQPELKNDIQAKSYHVHISSSSPIGTSRSVSKECRSFSDLKELENEISPCRLDMLRVDLVPVDISPIREFDVEIPDLEILSSLNGPEELMSSQSLIENRCSIRASTFEKAEAKNVEKVKPQLESKSSPGPTSNLQSIMLTRSRKFDTTIESGLKADVNVLENLDQVSDPYISAESDEVISKRTRSSLSLGDHKSHKKTGLRRKRQHDDKPDNNGPDAKVTRSEKVKIGKNSHSNDLKHAHNDVKDLDRLFADIEAGILTIQLAAKDKGLKYAKMYHLYRAYKMDKLKSYCEKIKTSNKIKEKYDNRCKVANSSKKVPAKTSENLSGDAPVFNPDNVEPFQEAVNVTEPSQEAVNNGLKNLQDRTDGIRNVKRELMNHLRFAEPLSKDDKKCLLEVLGVIHEALLKDP